MTHLFEWKYVWGSIKLRNKESQTAFQLLSDLKLHTWESVFLVINKHCLKIIKNTKEGIFVVYIFHRWPPNRY